MSGINDAHVLTCDSLASQLEVHVYHMPIFDVPGAGHKETPGKC